MAADFHALHDLASMTTDMNTKQYRIVFFGSSDFAIPAFKALAGCSSYAILAVVSQPDRPSGRGQKLTPTPLKQAALELGLQTFEPISLKSLMPANPDEHHQHTHLYELASQKSAKTLAEFLNENRPIDALVVASYGLIIPHILIDYAPSGIVNIHPSALPRWRGAAPLQHTIFAGDSYTEVCLMKAEEGVDTGPVFARRQIEISDSMTYGELLSSTSQIGADMLIEHLPAIIEGTLKPSPQDDTIETYASKWEKHDCQIVWDEDAAITHRRIRTCSPTPGAFSFFRGQPVKLYSSEVLQSKSYPPSASGIIVAIESERLVVACGNNSFLAIKELQLAGKKRLETQDVVNGYKLQVGERFFTSSSDAN